MPFSDHRLARWDRKPSWDRHRPAAGRERRRECEVLCVAALSGSFAPIMPNLRTKFPIVPAIDLVVERLGQARQIGDDEAAVGTLSPGLDARDDAALGIPAFGCVTEIAVAADLLRFARDAAQGGVLRERADPAQ